MTTAVLVAFHPEWDALVGHVERPCAEAVNGRTLVRGTLAGQGVVLAETGVSMVNAAMTTQLLIDRYDVTRLVVSGIAGGVDPTLDTGDVVVPERWGQFLEVGMGRAAGGTYVLPSLPGETDLAPYGMMIPRDVVAGSADTAITAHRWFPADPVLLDVARGLHGAATRLVVGGNGVSGSAFVDNADYRRYLHATFAARIVDMESAAVAQVAYANGIPFIALRALSDLAGGEQDANRLPVFMRQAATICAGVTCALLGALA